MSNAAPEVKKTRNLGGGGLGFVPAQREASDGDGRPAPTLSEITELFAALAACDSMQKIRAQSLWALKIALTAALTEGLCGEITIKIPQKANHPVEATFQTSLLS